MEELLYLPAPFFMARVPVLPVEDYYRYLDVDHLKDSLFFLFKSNAGFRQAILIASYSLYLAMKNVEEKGERKQEQLKSSLLKYFLRMTSRSTPFGLFSFVSLGKWGEIVSGRFDHKKLQKQARPDMEWIINVIDTIVTNPEYFLSLPVISNPLLTHVNGRIYLNYMRKRSPNEEKKSVSIRSNFLINAIVKLAQAPITVEELETKLFTEFPMIDRQRTRGVLKQLLDQQILISSLYPSLLTNSTFNDLLVKISHLKLNPNEYTSLKEIQQCITQYNKSGLDQGEDILLRLYPIMEKVAKSQNYLQVDLGYGENHFLLSLRLKQDLSEACEILWKISTLEDQENALTEYHEKFVEKYGYSRRVPLLELLHEDGLGAPESYLNVHSRKSDSQSHSNKWKKWLQIQRDLCLREKKHEIVLTDKMIDQLIDTKVEKNKAPLSFDLQCNLICESEEKFNHGDYQVNLINTSPQAGNFFGRFLGLLGAEANRHIRELYQVEEALDKQCHFVEISYFPLSARIANVATHPNLRPYQLDLANAQKAAIKIDEIYVGANEQGFYLTNKGGDKEWVFRSGNMLTLAVSPIAVRFLRDVSLYKHGIFRNFFWRDSNDSSFLPRISYKRVILSAARWNIDLAMLEGNDKSSLSFIEEKLKAWMDCWEMPRYLFLAEGDNQILLDRKNRDHIEEIARKIKIHRIVNLIEKIEQTNRANWVRSLLGTHLSEIVIPFTRNPRFSSSKPTTSVPKVLDISQMMRRKGPGSDWLYLKIYLPTENHERFISGTLSTLTTHLIEQEVIKQWFFIRYQDKEGPHLRIRFQGEKEKIISLLISKIHDWSIDLYEEKSIQNLYIGTYDREVERYGGEKLIEAIENLFCVDTLCTLDLLKIVNQKNKKFPNYVVAAISLLDFVNKFSSIFESHPTVSIALDQNKSELKGIREWKKTLCDFFENRVENDFSATNDYFHFQNAFQKREKQLIRVVQLIQELHTNQELSVSVISIFHSLVHMHCNRILGVEQTLEKKARLYADYAIVSRNKESYDSFPQNIC